MLTKGRDMIGGFDVAWKTCLLLAKFHHDVGFQVCSALRPQRGETNICAELPAPVPVVPEVALLSKTAELEWLIAKNDVRHVG